MFKDKITSLFKMRNKTIDDYAKTYRTSKQNIYRKIRTETLSAKDLAKVANFLGMDLVLESDSEKVVIKVDDFSVKVDTRVDNGNNFSKSKVVKVDSPKVDSPKVEPPDLTEFIKNM